MVPSRTFQQILQQIPASQSWNRDTCLGENSVHELNTALNKCTNATRSPISVCLTLPRTNRQRSGQYGRSPSRPFWRHLAHECLVFPDRRHRDRKVILPELPAYFTASHPFSRHCPTCNQVYQMDTLLQVFDTEMFEAFLVSAMHVTHPPPRALIYRITLNNIWRNVQIIKLPVTQCAVLSANIVVVMFSNTLSVFLPQSGWQNFTPIQKKTGKIIFSI